MPAPRAMPLPRRRPRRCRRRADAPPPPRWRICWCRNTATTFRYTARAKSTPARASNSTAQPCPIGWARPPGCLIRWSRGSANTSLPPRRSMVTTPRFRCCFLQADGYAGFEALYDPARTKPGRITEVACLAHCRRRFYDVWEATKSPVAKEALDRIAAVYAIEEKARFAPAAERVEHRRETAPLLEAFFDWSKATVVKLSGKSALAEAFRYTIKRQEALTRFVTDGRLEVGRVDDWRGGGRSQG